jgi:hypothetical protein
MSGGFSLDARNAHEERYGCLIVGQIRLDLERQVRDRVLQEGDMSHDVREQKAVMLVYTPP